MIEFLVIAIFSNTTSDSIMSMTSDIPLALPSNVPSNSILLEKPKKPNGQRLSNINNQCLISDETYRNKATMSSIPWETRVTWYNKAQENFPESSHCRGL